MKKWILLLSPAFILLGVIEIAQGAEEPTPVPTVVATAVPTQAVTTVPTNTPAATATPYVLGTLIPSPTVEGLSLSFTPVPAPLVAEQLILQALQNQRPFGAALTPTFAVTAPATLAPTALATTTPSGQ